MRRLVLAAALAALPTLSHAHVECVATGHAILGQYRCPRAIDTASFGDMLPLIVFVSLFPIGWLIRHIWLSIKAAKGLRYWQRYHAMKARHEWETAEWEAMGCPKRLGELLLARQKAENAPYKRDLAKYWASIGVKDSAGTDPNSTQSPLAATHPAQRRVAQPPEIADPVPR
jgi:hypothetical protein